MDLVSKPAVPAFRWWAIAWIPLAVPVAFVVLFWSRAQLEPVWLVRPLVVVLAAGALLTAVCAALAGSLSAGALAATLIGIGIVADDVGVTALLLVAGGVVIVWARIVPLPRQAWLSVPLRAGRAFSAAILAVVFVNAVLNGSLPAAVMSTAKQISLEPPAASTTADAPDIWVILLDGYPGDDAAAGLDPTWNRNAFADALVARGFDVHRNSRSDYLLTRLVLPALFSGRPVTELVPPGSGDLATQSRLLRAALNDGAVLHSLGDAGYERIAINSGWSDVGPMRADRRVELGQLTDFEIELMRGSSVGTIVGALLPHLHSDQVRSRITDTYASAADVAREAHDAPRFVFVHVPSPHPPVVFGSDGTPVNGSAGESMSTDAEPPLPRDDRIARQLAETTWISRATSDLVDAIQGSSARPPVIVVLSDHGTDIDWDPNHPLDGGIGERSSNILAVTTPGHADVLPARTTPVNVLVRILDAYGLANLPVQPDTTWSYRKPSDILDMVRVDPATGALR